MLAILRGGHIEVGVAPRRHDAGLPRTYELVWVAGVPDRMAATLLPVRPGLHRRSGVCAGRRRALDHGGARDSPSTWMDSIASRFSIGGCLEETQDPFSRKGACPSRRSHDAWTYLDGVRRPKPTDVGDAGLRV
jgi:hypothetical protein